MNSARLATRTAMHGTRRAADRDATDLRAPAFLSEGIAPPSLDDVAAARQQIQARATDAPEAQRLMAMLGIA